MKRFNLLFILLFAALLFNGNGCSSKQKQSQGEQAVTSEPGARQEANLVYLTPEEIETAGIVTEVLKISSLEETLPITGKFQPLPQNTSVITSRVPGKVLRLLVEEGQEVKKGDALILIDSVEQAQADAYYHASESRLALAREKLVRIKEMAKLGYFGQSSLETARVSWAEAQSLKKEAEASLEVASKNYLRLKELNTEGIVADKELELAEAAMNKTQAQAEATAISYNKAKVEWEREQKIFTKGFRSQAEIQEAEKEFHQALSDFQAAQKTMSILQVNETDHGRTFTITCPISGAVTGIRAVVGQALEPTTELMRVINNHTLWLVADIYETDLAKVKGGQKVIFAVKSYPQKKFLGTLVYLAPEVDQASRTVKARIRAVNSEGILKSEMFAEGAIILENSIPSLTVSQEAVQSFGEQSIVYLQVGEGSFQPRTVKTGRSTDGKVEIIAGLSPGDRIVVRGAFLLKSEQLKESLVEEE